MDRLVKGSTYSLTISGVDLTAKITRAEGHVYRAKITRGSSYKYLTFHAGQVTHAERLTR